MSQFHSRFNFDFSLLIFATDGTAMSDSASKQLEPSRGSLQAHRMSCRADCHWFQPNDAPPEGIPSSSAAA